VTLRVHDVLHPQFAGEPGLSRIYHDIEMPVRQVIWQIERTGILVDAAVLARQSHEMGQKIMALEAQAYELAGQPFNLASPKQLADILFEKQGLPVKKKTPSGGPSTDEEVLSELALDYPLPKLLLEHRSLSKLKGTYTDKLPRMVNPQTWACAHQLCPGRRGHWAAGLQRPQSAEHSGAQRGRPENPYRLHRPAGQQHRLGRLFADRAAHHGPPVGRRSACSTLSPTARTCTAPRPAKSSASRRSKSAPTSAASPRASTSA
jgi:hypothetical protein